MWWLLIPVEGKQKYQFGSYMSADNMVDEREKPKLQHWAVPQTRKIPLVRAP